MRAHLSLLLVLFSTAIFAAADTLVVRDLSITWKAYDPGGEIAEYLPEQSQAIFFEVPDVGGKLLIEALEPIDIWVDGRLLYHGFSGALTYPVDSLLRALGQAPDLTIYRRQGISREALKTVIFRLTESQGGIGSVSFRSPPNANFYLMICTLMIFVAGIFKRLFPISFQQAFQSPLTFKMRSLSAEEAYMGFGSADNLFTLAFFGMLTSTLLSYLDLYPLGRIPGFIGDTFWVWLLTALFIPSLVTLKYLWASLLASVFEFRSIPNIQTQDFLSLFILILASCLAISVADFALFNSESVVLKSLVFFVLVSALLFYQVWFYLKVDKYYSHRKLMIITYLCTTEFLPGFLIIYWLVKV